MVLLYEKFVLGVLSCIFYRIFFFIYIFIESPWAYRFYDFFSYNTGYNINDNIDDIKSLSC